MIQMDLSKRDLNFSEFKQLKILFKRFTYLSVLSLLLYTGFSSRGE